MMRPSIHIRSVDRNSGQALIQCAIAGKSHGITGRIRGPFCKYSRTLPSNYRISDGQCVVVDPCYWTPRLPFLYEVSVTYENELGTHNYEFKWGLRWCVAHKNGIRLDGKPHVVRAIAPKGEFDLADLRELSASLIVREYSSDLCEAASEQGVMLVCHGSPFDDVASELRLHPAVHFAPKCGDASDVVTLTQNKPAPHSVCLLDEETASEKNGSLEYPQFVVRRGVAGGLADLRKECDWLQRDMAKFGQFAGYLIESQS